MLGLDFLYKGTYLCGIIFKSSINFMTYKGNILALIQTSIDSLCGRMVNFAKVNEFEPTFEPDIVFETLNDQESSYISEFDCITRTVTIDCPHNGEYKMQFEKLSLEHQLELIDQLEDELKYCL